MSLTTESVAKSTACPLLQVIALYSCVALQMKIQPTTAKTEKKYFSAVKLAQVVALFLEAKHK